MTHGAITSQVCCSVADGDKLMRVVLFLDDLTVSLVSSTNHVLLDGYLILIVVVGESDLSRVVVCT